ncbi:MAG: GNAT family N-acetyltransferase, partial [Candidatus Peribacteraceae bacterium]|nr:GNAT family N-acetyltransferase [Candidatus Peribacteraceae bacterium]
MIIEGKTIRNGELVRLRPLAKEHMELKVRWYNDPVINKTLIIDEPLELEKSLKWIDKAIADETRVDFIIESADGEPAGIVGLVGIDRKHGLGESFCIIGERKFWGRGFATIAHSLMFEWAFEALGLHKIWAVIYTNNPAIEKVVARLGYKIEGTLREEKCVHGERIDLYRI